MKTIPLEKATKAEIIAAIKEEYAFGDVRRRLETAVYHERVKALIDEMQQAADRMESNRQPSEGRIIHWKLKNWQKWNEVWTKADRKLSELQGF